MRVGWPRMPLLMRAATCGRYNPLERGHIAFRTDDIEAIKARLTERGVPSADFGAWAIEGWHQIFFHDPEGNIVEVHQVGAATS